MRRTAPCAVQPARKSRQDLGGYAARARVDGHGPFQRIGPSRTPDRRPRSSAPGYRDHGCDVEEADASSKKGRHADLIGRVHRRRRAAPRHQRLSRHGQRRETTSSGASKVSWPTAARSSFRPARSAGRATTRRRRSARACPAGQVAPGGAVGVFHEAVHHRLGMNHNVDLLRRHREQVGGLDHLQALVHHLGGIDGNLRVPCSSWDGRWPVPA